MGEAKFQATSAAAPSEQMPIPRAPDYPSLSLFTGAGGLDLGLELAGFTPALAVELDSDCRKTLHLNRPKWKLSEPGDITLISPQQILLQSGLKEGDVAAIVAGPPCQPFSKSAFWAGPPAGLSDPRAATITHLMTLVGGVLPEILLVENVRGIGHSNTGSAKSLIEKELGRINGERGTGYELKELRLDAASFGVPQRRERTFLFAHRGGRGLEMVPTHASLHQEGLAPFATAWDAIGHLDDMEHKDLDLTGKWANLLPSIPEGANYLHHTAEGGGKALFGYRTRYWTFLLKLAKALPSWTIQAQPGPATGPFHWKNRLLSSEELACLQTFPTGYAFSGSYRSVRQQIGNAVPGALAHAIGSAIAEQIFGCSSANSMSLVPSRRTPIPAAEATSEVPQEYSQLVGEHAKHPGHGLGPGALLRKAKLEEEALRQVQA